ncbi:DUF2278 family protein [Novosphingobium sp.]|uniref:DUF2278 family protein n=1 Tax=Novosphingobium sp. TaxID=1874826 RepID=UPI003B522F50
MAADRVIFIRHAEKPTDGQDGVDQTCALDPESLVPAGWQRAGALVRFFDPAQVDPVRGALTPQSIFASGVGAGSKSRRSIESITPLAQTLQDRGVPFITSHFKADYQALADDVATRQGVVLIAWEHKQIPVIAALVAPGAMPPPPPIWPDRFDLLWVFDLTGAGWSFSEQRQSLLPGDEALENVRKDHPMTLAYGYVKAKITSAPTLKPSRGHDKHKHEIQYHLHFSLDVGGEAWEIAMNVGTSDSDDLLKYKLVFDFRHPVIQTLTAAVPGKTDLTGQTALPALDFERSDILAGTGPWRDSGLMDGSANVEPAATLTRVLEKALAGGHDLYVFGRFYTGGDLGIHDTHMNQGSVGSYIHAADDDHNDHNDIWQDGALVVDLGEPEWTAYFAAFDQQLVPTTDLGNPEPDAKPLD